MKKKITLIVLALIVLAFIVRLLMVGCERKQGRTADQIAVDRAVALYCENGEPIPAFIVSEYQEFEKLYRETNGLEEGERVRAFEIHLFFVNAAGNEEEQRMIISVRFRAGKWYVNDDRIKDAEIVEINKTTLNN